MNEYLIKVASFHPGSFNRFSAGPWGRGGVLGAGLASLAQPCIASRPTSRQVALPRLRLEEALGEVGSGSRW